MKKILVTGGAGYIGSVLTRLLLNEGYDVRALDNLMFGGESIVDYFNYSNFEFIKGDIRDEAVVKDALKDVDAVVHFASIVGDPACKKDPELARSTNLDGSRKFYDLAEEHQIGQFIFASTCSNYGKMDQGEGGYVDENSKLAPVSLYAETKVETEKYLLNQPQSNYCKPTCLRFSTVYGLSPRIRFDLTVNEFTKELAIGRELEVYGEQFWRPYCHVEDLARSVLKVLEASKEKVGHDVFNVGDTKENYQKKMIIEEIQNQIPGSKVKYVPKDEDPRDYKVSFEKINKVLGYEVNKTVPDGIRQVKTVIKNNIINNPDDGKYANI